MAADARHLLTPGVVALAVVAATGCGGDPPERRDARQRPPVTIDAPAAGMVTSARTIVVRGRAPWVPPGDGESLVTLRVNGRLIETFPERSGYSTPVALELGRNEIVVRGDAESFDGPGEPVRGTARTTVERRRAPGDDTGVLDRATAYLLADSTRKTSWLCGEYDECSSAPVCFALGPRRVDCPVAVWYVRDKRRRCGHVYTLRLRGDRLYGGNYECRGLLNPNPRERFVQPSPAVKLRRIIGHAAKDAPWERAGFNEPNRYGAPRFSIARDVFLP